MVKFIDFTDAYFGRGSWIRTNDLQYPKLISHILRCVLAIPQVG
jgi:hypothetical protein